jgi:hypothetical protein
VSSDSASRLLTFRRPAFRCWAIPITSHPSHRLRGLALKYS